MKSPMFVWVLLAVVCLTAGTLPAQINLDFKEGQLGDVPKGWALTTPKGYSAKLTDQCSQPQSRCAVLRWEGQETPEPFGNLLQAFDATPYRNKSVRFRASVRVDSPPDVRAQLWFRVDRAKQQMGFFDNMANRPILSSRWASCEIVGGIDPDAERIFIGMMLFGRGAAYIEGVSVEVVGNSEIAPVLERSRPLAGRGLENLTAFARLFGYVRHFHPSDEAAAADWDALAVSGVRAIEDAKDPAELAKKLEAFFQPVAPTLRVFPASQAPPQIDLEAPAGGAGLKLIAWRHRGFGSGAVRSIYRSERVTSPPDGGKLPAPFAADLGGGVKALVPLALFADAQGTLPHAATPPATKGVVTKLRYTADDRAVRLADVIIAWNVFQHFYPYFDVVKTDWPGALTAALTAAAADKDAAAFNSTLRRLVAELHDGHGRVSAGDSYLPRPVAWDWVEGQLVITRVPDDLGQSVAPGDVVTAINGKPIRQAIAETEPLISAATPQWLRVRLLGELGAGPAGEPLVLELDPFAQPGKRHTVELQRKPGALLETERRPLKLAQLKFGVWYVDLTRMSDGDWKTVLPKIENATGLIFDMRGYPSGRPLFLQHLRNEPMTSAQWHVPVVTLPDRREMKFERGGEWNLKPLQPYLGMKKVFLTDGRAISYAESCMGIVEHYRLGEIVGGPTAGTNGNVNPLLLPGGYTLAWTGMKVLKHDGSQHHGIGILPTVPVSRTRAGVAAGRDEILERALELLK